MNALLSSFVKQIESAVDDLAETLSEVRAERDRVTEQKEDLLQQYWSRGREITVMQANAEEFDSLQARCEKLRAERQELRDRLGKVLSLSKALASEFRQ